LLRAIKFHAELNWQFDEDQVARIEVSKTDFALDLHGSMVHPQPNIVRPQLQQLLRSVMARFPEEGICLRNKLSGDSNVTVVKGNNTIDTCY
jgi:hypothetical protein